MKVILYHGLDQDFYQLLEDAGKSIPHCNVLRTRPDEGTLIDHAFVLRPHIVIVDAGFAGYLAEEVRSLKKIAQFKSIVFAGYCKDELEAREAENLLLSGVLLLHMMDTDFDTFFRDCFEMAFAEQSTNPDFARAKNLEIPLGMNFLSTFTSVNPESFVFETDLNLSQEISLRVPMSSDESELIMKITSKADGALTAPFLYSYKVNFTYPGPWDESNDNSLSQATVETWIDLREKYFDKRNQSIAIFTQDNEFIRSMLKSEGLCWYQIYRSAEELIHAHRQGEPGVVFFDLRNTDGADLMELGKVILRLREINPTAMVVILGSKSDSAALRKVFDYEYLISYPGSLEMKMFQAMEKKFLDKQKSKKEDRFLKPSDADRLLRIKLPAILTSLTERDMTFILDQELPYFTVIEVDLPLPAYLTIIPAEGQLATSKKGTHYRAIIHGLGEENLTKLRKITNQLIYHPTKSMTSETVETMLKQDYVAKEKKQEKKPPILPESFGKKENEDNTYILNRNLRGKTKL